jgi:two-component system NtrC family sensor kinase
MVAPDPSPASSPPQRRQGLLIGIVIAGGIALLLALLYAIATFFLFQGLNELEATIVRQDTRRALDAIAAERNQVRANVCDYARWDSPYDYMANGRPGSGNHEFERSSLVLATQKNLDLNVLAVLTPDGTYHYGQQRTATGDRLEPLAPTLERYLSAWPQRQQPLRPDSEAAGWLQTERGPMLLGLCAITNRNVDAPARGVLVMGRYVDQARLDAIEQQLRVSVALIPLTPAHALPPNLQAIRDRLRSQPSYPNSAIPDRAIVIIPDGRDRITSYIRQDDLNGTPLALIQVATTRSLHQEGILASRTFGWVLLIAGSLFGGLSWWLLQRFWAESERRARTEEALARESALRETNARYREKAIELEQALDELRQTQGQLIHTEKMSALGRLVAGVAHEINNPASFIMGNLTYLQESWQQAIAHLQRAANEHPPLAESLQHWDDDLAFEDAIADVEQAFQSAQNGTNRIRNIILSLRTFAHLDREPRQPVPLDQGLDSTLDLLQHRASAQGDRPAVRLIRHYDPVPPVPCNVRDIHQVFAHLLENAFDAFDRAHQDGPPDYGSAPPTLTLRLQQQDHCALIAIANNGPPIPPHLIPQLFDPFFTTKPVGQGTGLGLFSSHQIVRQHGGTLRVSSMAHYTEFTIALPLQPTPPRLQKTAATSP